MTFSLVNPLGWALYEILTSAQMNALDQDHVLALDGQDGGVYALLGTLELDGGAIPTGSTLRLRPGASGPGLWALPDAENHAALFGGATSMSYAGTPKRTVRVHGQSNSTARPSSGRSRPRSRRTGTGRPWRRSSRPRDRYWQALEALFASQDRWTVNHRVYPERIWPALGAVGLDLDRARREMNAPDIAARIEKDLADAAALKVEKTPEYFVNGRPMPRFGLEELQGLVAEELRKAYR